MAKPPLSSPRRAPKFAPTAKPAFFLPPRTAAPTQTIDKPGHHTYYLSCDPRSLAPYLPHAVHQFHKGFRAVLVAPAGLSFDAPAVTLLGLQNGSTFDHGMLWAMSNPLDELQAVAQANRASVTLKGQEKAQTRFADAIATLEGVAEAQREAEAELEAATSEIILLQGVDSIFIDGDYYDPTYNRERVFLKRRDPRFHPVVSESETAKKTGKKASKRSGRAA